MMMMMMISVNRKVYTYSWSNIWEWRRGSLAYKLANAGYKVIESGNQGIVVEAMMRSGEGGGRGGGNDEIRLTPLIGCCRSELYMKI